MSSAGPQQFGDDDPNTGYNRVWFNLMRVQRSSGARIARALRGHGIDDPIWYEILMELDNAAPDGMPMATLEKKLFLPQYALSRHASRMEKADLLKRYPAAGRGRGQVLRLTEKGKDVHVSLWDAYADTILDEFGHRLTVDEAYALARLLIRLYP